MSERWETRVLRLLEYVAYPALGGAAFALLCLGVVTWLPALAALAYSMREWRAGGDGRCFTNVFRAFGRYWRRLWRHALVSTAAVSVLVANSLFLTGKGAVGVPLLMLQLGMLAAAATYHLALAACAGLDGPDGATPAAELRARAVRLAFGAPRRGLALLAALVIAPVVTLPVPLGPVLFGASVPVLVGLRLADKHQHTAAKSID